MKDPDKTISRRTFIGCGVASVLGAGIGLTSDASILGAQESEKTPEQTSEEKTSKPQIKEYRKLGGTGWKVSDIAFGGAGMKDPSLLEYAMDRGINYVDTARQYYDMEKVIGQLFPQKRDKLFVTTKLMPELITIDVTTDQITTAIDESIERLNTDYVDACLIHSVGDPNLGDIERLRNPNIHEAFAKAKQAGKIRAWGASSHGPTMVEEFNWLLDNSDIGLIMPGMNYLTKGLEPILAKARKKGVAVVAMKSMSMARKVDFSEFMKEGRTLRQALLKWLLGRSNIDTISLTMRNFEDVDEFVGASGKPKLSLKEKEVLEKYGMRINSEYCRPGCAGCLHACPNNVPIHDILRYRLYFNNYGREKYAMGLYASLPESRKALQCTSCTGSCASSCPYSIPIREKLIEAHADLTV
ncbi:MAG: hypothetical protein GTO42_08595 [Candidatus Latescibacteria bacterium]|nr:hypothetical protein [Candidatus Latescibacterota bacterium]NIO29018.1 hypothetical protein [Candidatus Latescibacterota bacterium]NIO56643.1 hypothetical protein [Candidatus Latescibacterota bacterium]NIT02226.1 hypothetical protein [Candidatus Latescibacterota bacterium]NIT39111.1 hypothetical protein [Candidatus Latescibacterota bacterium]